MREAFTRAQIVRVVRYAAIGVGSAAAVCLGAGKTAWAAGLVLGAGVAIVNLQLQLKFVGAAAAAGRSSVRQMVAGFFLRCLFILTVLVIAMKTAWINPFAVAAGLGVNILAATALYLSGREKA